MISMASRKEEEDGWLVVGSAKDFVFSLSGCPFSLFSSKFELVE